jgi:serine/threonine protein kinase
MSDLAQLVDELLNGSTDLQSCLSRFSNLSLDDQFQLVLADQKFRVQRGEPCDADHYAQILPWIAKSRSRQQELITGEFFVRLGSVSANQLIHHFTAKYSDFGDPLQSQLLLCLEVWNSKPLSEEAFDTMCDRFEEQVTDGCFPRFEDFIVLAPVASHAELLRELILIETYHRRRNWQSIDWDDYRRRLPDQTELIGQLQKEHVNNQPLAKKFSVTKNYSRGVKPNDLSGSFTSNQAVDDLRDIRYQFARKAGQAVAETVAFALQLDDGSTKRSAGDRVRYFGEYELLEEIARGGMGVVFKARQVKLSRIVALKMILAGDLAGEEEIQRFKIEAEAAANLDHPGIVPIYEIGDHEGQHYFSMGFVDGISLAERVKEGPVPSQEAAWIVSQVAKAIAHAHSKGVIHRDLKPANILLDAKGEPRVTDFGLAKQIQSHRDLTRTGAVMGTPSYMPPEQAAGKSFIGATADVYSLGAVLYAILTGRPPFQSANIVDTIMQVLECDPVPPRQLDSQIECDLETICLKCLAKSPNRRYASAAELVDDLERFLNDQPIQARPPGIWERTSQWARNHVATVTTMMLFLASSLFIIPLVQVVSSVHQSSLQRQRNVDEFTEPRFAALSSIQSASIIREMTRIIREQPTNAPARFDRACAFIARGEYEFAIDDVSVAIALEPRRADFHYLRGVAQFRLKQFNKAIEDFTTTIDLRPEFHEAHLRRAQAWMATESLPNTLKDTNSTIALRPSCGEAYLLRGKVLRRTGKAELSVKDFTFARRLGVPLQ